MAEASDLRVSGCGLVLVDQAAENRPSPDPPLATRRWLSTATAAAGVWHWHAPACPAVDRLLADPPLTRRADGRARRELPGPVGRANRRVAAHVKVADQLAPGKDRDREWHEARKASKRLRYAAEAAAPVLGKPAERLVKQVKQVQELLGDHQDAVVARPVLREIGIAAHLDGENGFTYGLLHQQQTDAGRLHDGEISTAWKDLRRRVRDLAGCTAAG